jgi:fructose-1,6-bisphosphatase I
MAAHPIGPGREAGAVERITLRRAIERAGQDAGMPAGEMLRLVGPIEELGIILDREIPRAAFLGWLGATGGHNVAGDAQKKLDIVANDVSLDLVKDNDLIRGLVSEELDEPRPLAQAASARYLLAIDPLDGSSNTDVNGSLGTVFGYYRVGSGEAAELPRGTDLVIAGYVLYGPGTVLVVADARRVRAFSLDRESGEFLLTQDGLECPTRGRTYSANLGNARSWHPNLRAYIDHITERDEASRRPYTLRYSGALVADLHRLLIEGGIYFYPPDGKNQQGKLRYLYECAPLAFVTERAGGRATTGTERILDLRPASPHQRSPLVIGSDEEVALYERFVRDGRPTS